MTKCEFCRCNAVYEMGPDRVLVCKKHSNLIEKMVRWYRVSNPAFDVPDMTREWLKNNITYGSVKS
jgi:hypothetical protein